MIDLDSIIYLIIAGSLQEIVPIITIQGLHTVDLIIYTISIGYELSKVDVIIEKKKVDIERDLLDGSKKETEKETLYPG